jgi:hypothetical protein
MIYLTMYGQRAACRSLCLSIFILFILILCPVRRPKPLCVISHPEKAPPPNDTPLNLVLNVCVSHNRPHGHPLAVLYITTEFRSY